MLQLPVEILVEIFTDAIAMEQSVGHALCLTNHSIKDLAQPILYHDVRLYGVRSMNQFTNLMKSKKSSRKYVKQIHHITVMGVKDSQGDDDMRVVTVEKALAAEEAWEKLCAQIWRLGNHHTLSSLAFSSEFSGLLYNSDFVENILVGSRIPLPLDHLVLCGLTSFAEMLELFKPKKLTLYCCHHGITSHEGETLISALQQSKSIKEFNLYIGNDNLKRHAGEYGMSWKYSRVVNLDLLKLMKNQKIKLNILLNEISLKLKERVVQELRWGEKKEWSDLVSIGDWEGDDDVMDQWDAEDWSLRSGDWRAENRTTRIQDIPEAFMESVEDDIEGEELADAEEMDKEWCYCWTPGDSDGYDDNYGLDDDDYGLDEGDMYDMMAQGGGGGFDEDAYDSIHGYRAFEMAALSGDVPSWVIDRYAC